MRRRSNPWPAFVDLFSALLVFVFAAMLLGRGGGSGAALGREVDSIARAVRETIGSKWDVRKCGLDTCVDLNVEFQLGTDVFTSNSERQRLRSACVALKSGLDRLEPRQLDKIRVVIEGHADRQLKPGLPPVGEVLVNWEVSAQRAARVIYEFSRCGLSARYYPLVAEAYGDTAPLCSQHTRACYQRNRRVTLRLHVDSRTLE